jgi:DNA-binding LacI/PurR family transcriptional regulator
MKVVPKYQFVLESLEKEIVGGRYRPGQKVPSEAALVHRFMSSRITVGRAVRELVQRGLVERRAGSGTYVCQTKSSGWLFGLLIAELGDTEIFDPICRGMAHAPQARTNALLWGNSVAHSAPKEDQAWQLCQQYIARKVSGVFFAPLELTPTCDETNRKIIAALAKAGIPVVLLDRDIVSYPHRSSHDLVGIDNRRAGYVVTDHLLKLGCRRICFFCRRNSAPTVRARIAGFQEALLASGVRARAEFVQWGDPANAIDVRKIFHKARPEAFICGNDRTAANLMHTLIDLGHKIPRDVRIAGFDDVKYANLLAVPLTTIHQPCREIGEAAMTAMLERLARPELPGRDIMLNFKLMVRRSCGTIQAERASDSVVVARSPGKL